MTNHLPTIVRYGKSLDMILDIEYNVQTWNMVSHENLSN